ncbi:MAG TPA: zinc ribbon domain-containing protein [Pyrinomonadaceae bacterium]|nr:zinc ribbon domain-containing protein [Pyrinomonadaceae bacterium]
MWTCVSCGETENEETFKFCFSCGAPGPAAEGQAQEERPGPPQTREFPPAEPEAEQPPEVEAHEHGFRLPKALTSLGQRLRQATSAGGEQVLSVKVSEEAQEAVELLLQAGRYDNAADAAGFLLEEGVKAQSELLWVIREKLSEIERLRAELRSIGGRQQ